VVAIEHGGYIRNDLLETRPFPLSSEHLPINGKVLRKHTILANGLNLSQSLLLFLKGKL
jgi:hypothetical protein